MRTLALKVAAAFILFQLAGSEAAGVVRASSPSSSNSDCPLILVAPGVAVAPNQPEIEPDSTIGIINALCDVKLQIVGCLFSPTHISITCDANGDGVLEVAIHLKKVTLVNRFLVEATLPPLEPQLRGTAFPLACCGGIASITLTRTVGSGDDNAFGPFVESQTCPIDLGIRAPVVISATPSGGDCAIGQNLVIPGSCFLLADGKPNVTSVFAVEKNNPSHVIQSNHFTILNTNLIDAFFEFSSASAGKTFLIYASGPNGTSRNLTAHPAGAPQGCPLGNEQGVQVTFTCNGTSGPGVGVDFPPPPFVSSCSLKRNSAGAFILRLEGTLFREGQSVTIGGVTPKKLKFKNPDPADPTVFRTIEAKGKVCKGLPGIVVVLGASPLICDASCPN